MSEEREMKSLPAPVFAVVGKVNTGKSSVLATLLEQDDEAVIRISATPGETTRAQRLAMKVGEREALVFVDTPGFADAVGAMREIQEIHGSGTPGLEAVRTFYERYRSGEKFQDECALLGPVLEERAGVLYVVDASKPLKERYLAEMEVLRWTGRQRMALLNPQGELTAEREREWKERLGSFFNLVRTFDAHRARFGERVALLRALGEMDEGSAGVIGRVVRSLEDEWAGRREETAERVQRYFEKVLTMKEHAQVDEETERSERRVTALQDELRQKFHEKLREEERRLLKTLLKIHKHERVEMGGGMDFEATDLQAEETWRKWGLTRNQLVAAGAVTGGLTGVMVDVGSGGLTHGWGTLIGAGVGAAGAYFGGDELPDVAFDWQKGQGPVWRRGGAKALEVGAPKTEQFPFVMLDSILSAYRGILEWTHARRDREAMRAEGPSGRVTRFSKERRRVLAKWFAALRKGRAERELGDEVFRELVQILCEVEEE